MSNPLTILFGGKSATAIDVALTGRGDVLSARVPLDASLNETHELVSDVTDHEVEDGSAISDNIINRPRHLTIEGIITDAPIRFLSGIRTLIDGGGSRSQAAFNALNDLWKKRTPIIVSTGMEIYRNMAIMRLTFPRNFEAVEALRFTAEFKEIRTVASDTAIVDVNPDIADAAQPTKNSGSQKGTEPSAATQEKTKSWARQIQDFLR